MKFKILLTLGSMLMLGSLSCANAALTDVSHDDGAFTCEAASAYLEYDTADALLFASDQGVYMDTIVIDAECASYDGAFFDFVIEPDPCPALRLGVHTVPLITLSHGDTYTSWLCSTGNDPRVHTRPPDDVLTVIRS